MEKNNQVLVIVILLIEVDTRIVNVDEQKKKLMSKSKGLILTMYVSKYVMKDRVGIVVLSKR